MKGTIDQVEAFFSVMSRVWTRLLMFFLICWTAHLFGSAAAHFGWQDGVGLKWEGPKIGFAIHRLPADWTISLIFGAGEIAGAAFGLVLFAAGYIIAFTDISRLPVLLFVVLLQAWRTWSAEVGSGSVGLMVAGYTWQPLPGIVCMLALTLAIISIGALQWRKNQPKV